MTWNWNAISPQAGTNLVLNSSFEKWSAGPIPTGWSAVSGPTLAQVTTYTWRGAYSCAFNVAGGFKAIYQDIAVANGTVCTASIYLYHLSGTVTLTLEDNGGGNATSVSTSTVGYQRLTVSHTAANNGVRITLSATSGACYWDAAQVEAGSSATTYIDGDEPGCYWTGIPHASTSVRDGQSREGGAIVPLANYFLRIQNAIGAGTPPFKNVSLPFGLIGGEVYQRTIKQARNFVIRGVIDANPNTNTYHLKRRQLFDLLKADAVTPTQPVKLQFDDGAIPKLEIKAVYNGGLEGNDFDDWFEYVDVGFTAHDPLFYSEQESAAVLGYNQTVANANAILMRDSTGLWKAMGTGATGGLVNAMVLNPSDGCIYVAGSFTQMGGVANTRGIAKWNGSGWSALGTGANGTVFALAVDAAGNVYAGGSFTQMGGVANTSRIAVWSGAWSALSTGADNNVNAIAIGNTGIVYAGGTFANIGGSAIGYLAQWNGAAWSAVGSGVDLSVEALLISSYGNLIVGGAFTHAGGLSAPYIAYWDGTNWHAMSSGFSGGGVKVLALGLDKAIYAGGSFNASGSTTLNYIARWSGGVWNPLGTGLSSTCYALNVNPLTGELFAGGTFVTAGGLYLLDSTAIWNGSSWIPMDVDLPGSPTTVYSILADRLGNIYVGFGSSGSASSSVITTPANSSTKVYPRLLITGPGTLWSIINWTTGRKIAFNNLALQNGEVITINFQPGNISLLSNWRGNILPYVLNGSNLDWYLQPGNNNIAVMISNGTAATGSVMLWRNAYWSYDGVD